MKLYELKIEDENVDEEYGDNKKESKKDLLQYTEKIEKEIFKLANLEYKTIAERY